jgi:hypothetical protein
VERELLNVHAAVTSRLTPFAAVYGGFSPDDNTTHTSTRFMDWNAIGFAEGLLTGVAACPSLPAPPPPTITAFNICHAYTNQGPTDGHTPVITVSLATPTNGQYIHTWSVIPAGLYFTTTGDQISFPAERPDHYEVTCTRTYPGRNDISSKATATIWVYDCDGPNVTAAIAAPEDGLDANDVSEGDFLLTTDADSLAVFAHHTGDGTLYATLEDNTFVSPAMLEGSGMFAEFAALFAQSDPRNPLPVYLREFGAKAEGKTALLAWVTTSEVNSDHFDIERSATGKSWDKIGSVPTRNQNEGTSSYAYTDQDPGAGLLYYRLKMVDFDGTFAYSRIEPLQFGKDPEMVVFPNPVETGRQLQLLPGGSQAGKITVYDMTSKQVFESEVSAGKANLQSLPTGRYILRVRLKDGSESNHVIVFR